jgi:hypothetical protein
MKELIEVAEALKGLPGTDKWPWVVVKVIYMAQGKVVGSEVKIWAREEYLKHEIFVNTSENVKPFLIGPFLNCDPLSPWSADKWLEMAGAICGEFQSLSVWDFQQGYIDFYFGFAKFPSPLDYNKAILALGKLAVEKGEAFKEAWNLGQGV